MRLTDLEPRWLMKDGVRLGFAFRSPTCRPASQRIYWQTCMENPPSVSDQIDLWVANGFEDHHLLQPCNPAAHWRCTPPLPEADFGNISVTPSLDGSAGGLWHGFITNGEIVGGV